MPSPQAIAVDRDDQRRLGDWVRVAWARSGVVIAMRPDSPRLATVTDSPCPLAGMPLEALERGVYVRSGDMWRLERYAAASELEAAEARRNDLGGLLRGWFGPDAGQPGGESHYVRFTRWPDGSWHATPEQRGVSGPPCERGREGFIARVKVNQASGRPILLPIDRKRCPDVPMGDTLVLVYGQAWMFGFRKVAVNTAWTLA